MTSRITAHTEEDLPSPEADSPLDTNIMTAAYSIADMLDILDDDIQEEKKEEKV